MFWINKSTSFWIPILGGFSFRVEVLCSGRNEIRSSFWRSTSLILLFVELHSSFAGFDPRKDTHLHSSISPLQLPFLSFLSLSSLLLSPLLSSISHFPAAPGAARPRAPAPTQRPEASPGRGARSIRVVQRGGLCGRRRMNNSGGKHHKHVQTPEVCDSQKNISVSQP